MKALVRNPGETVKETDGVAGIDWETGAPLTNAGWEGGRPYTLIRDYVHAEEDTADEPAEDPAEEPAKEPVIEEVVVIGGKTYVLKS